MGEVIAILGMHRSGTSCLTGTLEEAGLFLGDVSRHNPFNLKGNHESSVIMALHEDVLTYNQSSWDMPPKHPVWPEALQKRRDELIAAYADKPLWGFKDPRALMLLDGWLEALPHMRFVGIFRHPLAVAASLAQRNQFPLERSMALWTKYNQKLLAYHARFGFPIIEFTQDAELFKQKLSSLLAEIGLPLPADSLNFFDASLQHQKIAEHSADFDAEAAAVYAQLKNIAL